MSASEGRSECSGDGLQSQVNTSGQAGVRVCPCSCATIRRDGSCSRSVDVTRGSHAGNGLGSSDPQTLAAKRATFDTTTSVHIKPTTNSSTCVSPVYERALDLRPSHSPHDELQQRPVRPPPHIAHDATPTRWHSASSSRRSTNASRRSRRASRPSRASTRRYSYAQTSHRRRSSRTRSRRKSRSSSGRETRSRHGPP